MSDNLSVSSNASPDGGAPSSPDGAAFDQTLVASADGGGSGPVDRRVMNPAFGTQGANFASALVVTGGVATDPNASVRAGVGGGFGLGVGVNNGQKQYFLVVRGYGEQTPNNRGMVSAERVTSDDPIVGRSLPTVTTTVTGNPAVLQTKGTLAGVPVADTIVASYSHFHNPKIDVGFAGGTNTFGIGDGTRTYATATNSGQFVFNGHKPLDSDEVEALAREGIDARAEGLLGNRPIPSVDKDTPTLFSSAVSAGVISPGGKPNSIYIPVNQATVTATFPIDAKDVPARFRQMVDKMAELQALPDKSKLQQYVEDLHNSPALMQSFQAWQQQALGGRTVNSVPASQPAPSSSPLHMPSAETVRHAAENTGKALLVIGGVAITAEMLETLGAAALLAL